MSTELKEVEIPEKPEPITLEQLQHDLGPDSYIDHKKDDGKSEKKNDQKSFNSNTERKKSTEKNKDDSKAERKTSTEKKFADQTWTEAAEHVVEGLTPEKPILETAGNILYNIGATIGEMGHQAINAVVSTPTSDKVNDVNKDK